HYGKIALIALSLTVAASLFAAGKIFPYSYVQEDLPNGLRLITVPDDFPNIVALYIVVGTGSRNEVEPGKSGFAHLFEHLMFRGGLRFPPVKYQPSFPTPAPAPIPSPPTNSPPIHTPFRKKAFPRSLPLKPNAFS